MTAAAENRQKVRITAGLDATKYTSTHLLDLMDSTACYRDLLARMHPDGLRCKCGSDKRTGHGKSKTGYPVFKCSGCGSIYSVLSGTVFSGCTLDARRLLLFMRLLGQGHPAAVIAREVGLHRNSVAQLAARVRIFARYRGN